MQRTALLLAIWLGLTLAACGTNGGRYDGGDLADDDGPTDDDSGASDDDDDVTPEVDDFTWIDADGNEVNLYDFLGRVVLLSTGAFWCVPCREEAPSLQNDIYEVFKGENFTLIQLIVEDADFQPATQQTAADWRDEFDLEFLVCADPDWSLRPYFVEEQLPFLMLLTPEFQIETATHTYDADIFAAMIEGLL
jgi:thiol-disulfide isomerase/thioredoxin